MPYDVFIGVTGRQYMKFIATVNCIYSQNIYFVTPQFKQSIPIDNNSALVQVIVWHRTSDTPLLEPMLA